MSSLAAIANATEQDTVNRCAAIINQFQQMPEKAIPRDVLRQAKGLAIMSVVKAGFIFSAKGGQGVVVAGTPRGWSRPFVATGGGGWGLQAGAQVIDFVIDFSNTDAARAGIFPWRKRDDRCGSRRCGRTQWPHSGLVRSCQRRLFSLQQSKGLFEFTCAWKARRKGNPI